MDEKEKADYVKSPYHCPYCNSDRIVALEFSTESFTQTVECEHCGKQWTDIYTITDVEPIESKST
jgi:transcription elongation factor Elf1